jgi:hypothetical protein
MNSFIDLKTMWSKKEFWMRTEELGRRKASRGRT